SESEGDGSGSGARDPSGPPRRRAGWALLEYNKGRMATLKDKVLFITGASRGIGLAIAERAARDGARVAVVGKTAEPHAKLPGTVFTACEAIEAAGGEALACICDIRSEEQVAAAIDATVRRFGGIDILVNNAPPIYPPGTAPPPMNRLHLLQHATTRRRRLSSQ